MFGSPRPRFQPIKLALSGSAARAKFVSVNPVRTGLFGDRR